MPVGFKDFYLTKKEQLLEGVKARMVAIGGRTLSPLLPPGHSIGKSGTRSSIGMVVLGSNQIMASAASLYPREEKKWERRKKRADDEYLTPKLLLKIDGRQYIPQVLFLCTRLDLLQQRLSILCPQDWREGCVLASYIIYTTQRLATRWLISTSLFMLDNSWLRMDPHIALSLSANIL